MVFYWGPSWSRHTASLHLLVGNGPLHACASATSLASWHTILQKTGRQSPSPGHSWHAPDERGHAVVAQAAGMDAATVWQRAGLGGQVSSALMQLESEHVACGTPSPSLRNPPTRAQASRVLPRSTLKGSSPHV